MTRQFSQAEMAELQARIEAANKELAEFEAQAKQEVENPTPVVSLKWKKSLLIQLVQCTKNQK